MALQQQEMFEPPARRRVIVPPGHENWWGVDPGTTRCAIATVTPERLRGWDLVAWPELRGVARLSRIYEEVRAKAADLARLVPPGLIVFERMVAPKDRPLNAEMEHAAAVIQTAVFDGARSVGWPPCWVVLVPGSWKKSACGRGDIYKPKRKKGQPAPAFDEYGVAVWARSVGYTGWSWDEVDAIGMAEAGRREFLLEVR